MSVIDPSHADEKTHGAHMSFSGQPHRLTHVRPFRYSPDYAPGAMRILELFTICACGVLLWSVPGFFSSEYFQQYLFCIFFVCIVYSCLASWANLYRLNALMRPFRQADTVVIAVLTTFVFLMVVIFGLDVLYLINAKWIIYFAVACIISMILIRFLGFAFLRNMSRRGIVGRNLVVLGAERQSILFLRKVIRDPPYFTAVLGVFTATPGGDGAVEGFRVLGTIEDLLSCARRGLVDDVVVAMPWNDDRYVIDAIETLKELPVNVYLASDLAGFDLSFRPVLGAFSQMPVFEVVQRPISGWSSALKTLLDYIVAAVALIFLFPLLLLVAVAIKLDSPGPVLFVQQRLGFNNRPFNIYKFRSMRQHAEPGGVLKQATRGDSRITRVGRVIRATSIDELPQLLNVLNGTMSLVGPRPHALSHNEEYGRQIRGYFARHKVKPGITGWAQVNGLRGETADLETMRRRVEHDVYYVENWSFLFDLKILVLTMVVVLFQKTAY